MRKPRNIPAAVLKTWQVFRPLPDCFVELTLVLLAIKNQLLKQIWARSIPQLFSTRNSIP